MSESADSVGITRLTSTTSQTINHATVGDIWAVYYRPFYIVISC